MICKEQAFGFMTTKWRSLRQPLQVWLKYVEKLFMWITILHNFCINEGYVYITNAEDSQGNKTWFMRSDIDEISIAENSVFRGYHSKGLAQWSLERLLFN